MAEGAGAMGPVIVVSLVAAGVLIGHVWDARRIRAWFAAEGATVVRIRWQPRTLLRSLTFRQLSSFYRVQYRDRDGAVWVCRFVCGWWNGLYPIEAQRMDASPGVPSAW